MNLQSRYRKIKAKNVFLDVTDSEQKYDFLGEAACQFAINGIVARHYPLYDNRILSALVKKFRDLSRLHKILDQEIHLKDHVLAPYVSQTMDSILG
jgi:hypothetical protein